MFEITAELFINYMLQTKILNTEINYPQVIDSAAKALMSGGIIVYPTETVYGIGCSIFDTAAVGRLYKLKNRQRELPLTANIAAAAQVYNIAIDIPDEFFVLAGKFLPGPLSIILKKNKIVPDIVTSGMDTVAIRIPDNKCFLDILDTFGQPVAGTSANLSGKGSIAESEEVLSLFKGNADIIIDDGDSRIGIESTIVSLAGSIPKIVRTGAIHKEEIESTLKMKLF